MQNIYYLLKRFLAEETQQNHQANNFQQSLRPYEQQSTDTCIVNQQKVKLPFNWKKPPAEPESDSVEFN